MRDKDPVIVEFVGLPASGKTTVATAVSRQLQTDRGDRISTSTSIRGSIGLPTIILMIFSGLIRSPTRCTRILLDLWKTKQRRFRLVLRYFCVHLFLESELRRLSPDEIHLADQGFIQHLWRIHLTSTKDSAEALVPLLDHRYSHHRPDLIVFIEIDHQVRFDRGDARGTAMDPEFHDPSHPEIVKDLDTYETIKSLISNNEPAENTVIEIENRRSNLRSNVKNITEHILLIESKNPPEGNAGTKK